MKRQFVLTHITCQTETPALLDSWDKSTPIKTLCPEKNCFPFKFRKNITRLIDDLSSFLFVSRKIVYSWLRKIAISSVIHTH